MENKIDISEYQEIFENIKQEVLKSQYRAIQIVNKELIFLYWHIGKIILENIKWGNKFIDNLSIDLKMEFPNIQGFSIRNLKYMKKIALEYPDFEFVQEVLAQITWYHNVILMDKIKNIEERKWYINETIKNGWSTNILKSQIKNTLSRKKIEWTRKQKEPPQTSKLSGVVLYVDGIKKAIVEQEPEINKYLGFPPNKERK